MQSVRRGGLALLAALVSGGLLARLVERLEIGAASPRSVALHLAGAAAALALALATRPRQAPRQALEHDARDRAALDAELAALRETSRALAGREERLSLALAEARELRAVLERADRLASLGTLAAGIAHEVNNPLAYVAVNLGYVRDELKRVAAGEAPEATPQELREAVEEAISGTARVREIVAGLKQLATPATRGSGPVDVRAEIDAAVGMTRHEIAHRARLVVDVPPRLPPVAVGATELGQVFVNLLVNAAHAIPEGRAGQNEVRIAARAEGNRVMIEIRDTGTGIPPNVLSRIFDPFFTTKPVGGGTGLGLSISHGIVNSAGGTIEVESVPGQGATFRVILPAAPAAEPRPAPPAPAAAPARARVLVVDDEPLVGRALGRILGSVHDVVITTSPLEALRRLESGERFDLVLCDLMMPEMSGMELEASIARAAPDMVGRLVFMTGGAFTPAAQEFLRHGRPHLEKPIESAVLRELVARQLAGSRGG